jgi:hypothetical protein
MHRFDFQPCSWSLTIHIYSVMKEFRSIARASYPRTPLSPFRRFPYHERSFPYIRLRIGHSSSYWSPQRYRSLLTNICRAIRFLKNSHTGWKRTEVSTITTKWLQSTMACILRDGWNTWQQYSMYEHPYKITKFTIKAWIQTESAWIRHPNGFLGLEGM